MDWSSALFAVMLASMLGAVTVGWTYLLLTLWALRRRFEIEVRCPSLNIVVQTTNIVLVTSIILHWLLLMVDESLPCFIVFWISYAVLAFGAFPQIVRAARLVVAFSRRHRAKYARFVKSTTTNRVWAAITAGLFVRALLSFGRKPEHYSRNARECFYLDDLLLLWVIAFPLVPTVVLLALGLSKVDDAFKIRNELVGTLLVGSCLQGSASLGIQGLVAVELLPDTPQLHIIVEILTLLYGINNGIHGLLIPMVRVHRDGLRAWAGGNIVPVENVHTLEATTEMEGVLKLATKGGEMADMFDTFCKKHLCQESWDFIVDTTHYGNMVFDDPDEQHKAFLHILDQYLLPTSPNEVNVSCALSKRMASFRTRESFGYLNDGERRRILHDPLAEIVQMLEENLIFKFWKHVATEEDARLVELAGGDRELMALMKASTHVSGLGTEIT